MNKTELIDKLLHLGNTTEMCCSTDQHNAKELAHTLIDEYLEAINYTHSCSAFICVHKYKDNVCDKRGVRKCLNCSKLEQAN